MANMSYCRFENTLSDLMDCNNNKPEKNLSRREAKAFVDLIALCREIADYYEEYDDYELMELALETFDADDDIVELERYED